MLSTVWGQPRDAFCSLPVVPTPWPHLLALSLQGFDETKLTASDASGWEGPHCLAEEPHHSFPSESVGKRPKPPTPKRDGIESLSSHGDSAHFHFFPFPFFPPFLSKESYCPPCPRAQPPLQPTLTPSASRP